MSTFLTERRPDGTVVLTIDRPSRRNALDSQTLAELHTILDGIDGDPGTRAVVITGAGTAFSAGADMKAKPEDFTNTSASPKAALAASVESDVARALPPGVGHA